MSDDGYLADSSGFAYHRQTNPVFQRFCLLANGYAAPAPDVRSVHCELGFRQGVGINAHAAAQTAQFVGSDRNSTRVAFARSLAEVSGANVHLLDDSFEQLLQRSDLPQFDSISVHDIWSGRSRAERAQLVRFIDRHLKPGGMLYIQYDTMPGHSPEIALRKLLSLFNQMGGGTEGGLAGRVRAALDFAKKITTVDPAWVAETPLLLARIDQLQNADPAAVAREFFNPHWQPTYFTDMCQTLQAARLDWVCSAEPNRTLAALQAPDVQRTILSSTSHPLPREQMQDFFANTTERSDIFIRGARRLGSMEQRRALMDMRFVLLHPVEHVFKQLNLSLDADAQRSASDMALLGWLEYLSRDALAPKSPRGLLEAASEQTWIDSMLMLLMLVGAGAVAPAQSEADTAAVAERCAALNTHLCESALSNDAVDALVSPVLGGAISGIERLDQLLLLARQHLGASSSPEQWAAWLTTLMRDQGEYMLDTTGQPLPEAAHFTVLKGHAERFASDRLAVLQALQIA